MMLWFVDGRSVISNSFTFFFWSCLDYLNEKQKLLDVRIKLMQWLESVINSTGKQRKRAAVGTLLEVKLDENRRLQQVYNDRRCG